MSTRSPESTRTPESKRKDRHGFTFVEVSIALLIGLTIMGVAFTFYTHSVEFGTKAQQLSVASQAAAHFFYTLEQDIANLIPNTTSEDCFAVEDGDLVTGGTPGTRSFEFRRMDPSKDEQIKFEENRYDQRRSEGVQIRYIATKGKVPGYPDLWELSRFQSDPASTTGSKETRFSTKETGTYAKDVRFTKVSMPTFFGPPTAGKAWFLRVTLLLIGDAVNKDLKQSQQAPLVPLSALYRMTVDKFKQDPLQG